MINIISQGDHLSIKITCTERLYTPTEMSKTKISDNTKCWWSCAETGSLTNCWLECTLIQPSWKNSCFKRRWVKEKCVCLGKLSRRDPCGEGAVLCLGSVGTLPVIQSYSFIRCYHQGKLGEGHMGSLVFLTTACEPAIISKFNLKISLSLKCQDCVTFMVLPEKEFLWLDKLGRHWDKAYWVSLLQDSSEAYICIFYHK